MDRENKEETIKCDICDSELDEDSGNIVGEFGNRPVAFCVWCYSSMTDMVIQFNGFNDKDVLQGKIKELNEMEKDEAYYKALNKMYENTKERIRKNKEELV